MPMLMTSVKTRTLMAAAWAIETVWVTSRTRCLSRRSATTPPQAPNSSMGRNCAARTQPRSVPSPPRCSTSQLSATICSHVPDCEIV
jgi:hypothetical protein